LRSSCFLFCFLHWWNCWSSLFKFYSNTDINKMIKSCTDSLPLKTTTYYHKNDRQHKHGQYSSIECSYLTDY
jgi:hypothetical protein